MCVAVPAASDTPLADTVANDQVHDLLTSTARVQPTSKPAAESIPVDLGPSDQELVLPSTSVDLQDSNSVSVTPPSLADAVANDQVHDLLPSTASVQPTLKPAAESIPVGLGPSDQELVLPSTSVYLQDSNSVSVTPPSSRKRFHAVDISPYPKCERSEKRQRRSQRAEILTSSPFKKTLEAKELTKKNAERRKEHKQHEGSKKNIGQAKETKKTNKENQSDQLQAKTTRKNEFRKGREKETMDTTPCGICNTRFCDDVAQANGRKWICCSVCSSWYHTECQGVEENCRDFICISCEDESE